jgi:hypothetical protein
MAMFQCQHIKKEIVKKGKRIDSENERRIPSGAAFFDAAPPRSVVLTPRPGTAGTLRSGLLHYPNISFNSKPVVRA